MAQHKCDVPQMRHDGHPTPIASCIPNFIWFVVFGEGILCPILIALVPFLLLNHTLPFCVEPGGQDKR